MDTNLHFPICAPFVLFSFLSKMVFPHCELLNAVYLIRRLYVAVSKCVLLIADSTHLFSSRLTEAVLNNAKECSSVAVLSTRTALVIRNVEGTTI